ncbi:MAG: hypothetical protein ACJ0O5_04820 [Flavobacteriaceae bacterium]|mgnify:FL=1|jgi:hypothetical protein
MSRKILFISCLFFCSVTFSQSDKYNLKNDSKFDSILKIKKRVDMKIFDENYYSIQVFSGGYNQGDSISKYVNEKYFGDSIYFYFETPNYKVRVGKYKSKIEAEKKLKEIKKEFKSAFVFKPSK